MKLRPEDDIESMWNAFKMIMTFFIGMIMILMIGTAVVKLIKNTKTHEKTTTMVHPQCVQGIYNFREAS